MDTRRWWLTWSTYGTWVPEERRDGAAPGLLDDGRVAGPAAGNAYWDDQRRRPDQMRRALREPPTWLSPHDAAVILASFLDTAAHHGWTLHAAAVMASHVEIVVEVDGDPPPTHLVRDFKSYASRALNQDRRYAPGVRGKWWTRSAATRPLPDDRRFAAAVAYVRSRKEPLAVHVSERGDDGSHGQERAS